MRVKQHVEMWFCMVDMKQMMMKLKMVNKSFIYNDVLAYIARQG